MIAWRLVAALVVALVAGAPHGGRAAMFPLELSNWPADAMPAEIGKRVAENLLPRWIITRPSAHNAPDAAWASALEFASLTRDAALQEKLVRRFDPFLAPGGDALLSQRRHVDHSVFGIVPLEIHRLTGDERCRELGLMFADRQWAPVADDVTDAGAMNALLAQGLSPETRWWIDDMYMITILQVQAFRVTGDAKYLDRAATAMAAYLEKLQRPNGLFHHGPDSPVYWGRGNGWVAAGMAELLSELPFDHPRRDQIMSCYFRMMEALVLHQASNGFWHQVIDHEESYEETSCTAMFAFAFIVGLKHGWLTKTPHARSYAQGARNAWLALAASVDADGNLDQVCVGTGQGSDLAHYLSRPTQKGEAHGQAPVLWCAVALLE